MEPYLNLKEEALKDGTDRYRIISEITSDFFYCLTIQPEGPMKITWIDGAYQKLLGYKADDITDSEMFTTIVHPEDLPVLQHAIGVLLSNRPHIFDYRVQTKNGGLLWVRDRAHPVWSDSKQRVSHIIGAIEDITERKEAEARLRESEKRYRQFFHEDLSGAYISRPDGRLIDCNPVFARIFGFASVQEALETPMASIYQPTDTRDDFLNLLHKNKKVINRKSIMRHRDGSRLDIIENTIGIFDDRENLIEIKGFLVDVTRQKQLETQLYKARKMETVGTLAGGIAHEFNNLLMTIQGNASLIQYELSITDPHYQMLIKIEEAVNRGVMLTQQLLGYAKKGKYEVRSLDLNRLVRQTTDVYCSKKQNIAIQYELSEGMPAILADQDQMEQVLLNLLTNAADAMDDCGKLTLKTSEVTHDHIQATLYVPMPGNYLKLTVRDTGSGMDELTCNRIFDPFFTTKEIGRGKGLGLASVYGIIKGHGGYIEVESQPDRGSTFSLFLPAYTKDNLETPAAVEARAAQGTVILIADDEELVLDVAVGYLKKLGYAALTASNGYEAVEVYIKNSDQIKLVILDLIMPHMGGGQAYNNIKQVNSEVKVLLSSGYSIDGQAQEILDRGCDGFIQKPFGMQELADKIKAILAENSQSG
ncbi:PAS/PAC sensor hybrid histidine kinase [Olavius algarvensis Delta 1 endosymbiont]|nr:PAS/PAC sensor hybrid histidine kinase [Olavius algarvensis Delta 1 endosymbiont]